MSTSGGGAGDVEGAIAVRAAWTLRPGERAPEDNQAVEVEGVGVGEVGLRGQLNQSIRF